MMKIHVGNLSADTTEEDLYDLFVDFGELHTVNLVTTHSSGGGKSFGFIEMPAEEEALEAISKLHNSEFKGSQLTVSRAKGNGRSRIAMGNGPNSQSQNGQQKRASNKRPVRSNGRQKSNGNGRQKRRGTRQ